jgi:hypothetical protein
MCIILAHTLTNKKSLVIKNPPRPHYGKKLESEAFKCINIIKVFLIILKNSILTI